MSRIGKKPVYIPEGVTVTVEGENITVKGPKGEMTRSLDPRVSVAEKEDDAGKAYIETSVTTMENSAIWGTIRSHIANMVDGVVNEWSKKLELNGVGFKMNVQGKKLVMSLGFSHEIEYALPEGINATIEGNVLTISGVNKEVVGKVAAEIRAFKKPEPYKGKGFRYTDETIIRKAGKSAKGE